MPRHNKVLTPAKKAALLECFQDATALVPVALRPQFVLVGGVASIVHSSCLWTDDVDIAASTEAHWCFLEAITQEGSRFKIQPCQMIEFNSRQGFKVDLELLELGGPFIESISAHELLGEGFVASLGDLILYRAETVVDRGTEGDVADLKFLIKTAAEQGTLIPARGGEKKEIMLEAATTLSMGDKFLLAGLMPIVLEYMLHQGVQ